MRIQNEFESEVKIIHSDHDGEFENKRFNDLCSTLGIIHPYLALRILQHNEVAERKNRTLINMSRTMLVVPLMNNLSHYFWVETVNICTLHS